MSFVHKNVIPVNLCSCINFICLTCTVFSDFATDDGTRRMLELAQEMEDVFPSYDLSGQRITTVHSHYRMLTTGCTAIFTVPDCSGDCTSCFGEGAKSKCESRKMRCKASSTGGISFPFMDDLAGSLLGLFSGDDFDIMEFRPPPMLFMFEKEITIFLFAPPVINLVLGFGASAAVEYALVRKNRVLFAAYSFSPCCGAQMSMIGTLLQVLDSRGIKEAVQERSPPKALNSFAIRDIIDGVDSKIIVLKAYVSATVEVSVVFVKVGVTGGLTARVGE